MAEAAAKLVDRDWRDPHRLADGAPYKLTVEQFDRMIDADVFGDRMGSVELVRGELRVVNAKYLPHAKMTIRLTLALNKVLAGSDYEALWEVPVTIAPDTSRQPDVLIFTKPPRGMKRLAASMVHLVVEIADTSMSRDHGDKMASYAEAGIATHWIIDLEGRAVRVCTEPNGATYLRYEIVRFGEPLSLELLAEARIVIPADGFD